MILVDTSVWIEHLRSGRSDLGDLLVDEAVLTHPFIIGELACGSFRNRDRVLATLQMQQAARIAEHEEVLALLNAHGLWGLGIGWVDAHLLASALLSRCKLWTLDGGLQRAAAKLGVAA